jgi:hypothetical protein
VRGIIPPWESPLMQAAECTPAVAARQFHEFPRVKTLTLNLRFRVMLW